MDKKTILDRFFEPLQPIEGNTSLISYDKLEYVKVLLNNISDILPHNSYIIDYYKKNFFFVSEHSMFLCGYQMQEVLNMGYEFYKVILSPEDLDRLVEINDKGFTFYYNLPQRQRLEAAISYDLLLKRKDGSTFCVNHRLKPFLYTDDGNVLLSVCCIRHSAGDSTGNVIVYLRKSNKRYSYSFSTKAWTELPSIELTDTEQYIVLETDKGILEKQQAETLRCSRSNIRYYKKRIMEKTGTNSMREAILFLFSNGML